MDLFEHARQEQMEQEAPLAARMRPRALEEFVGQEQIVGPGRLLRRAIQADQLSSLIFYGPPGTGKTTLARIIANTTRSHFETLNAVLAGVADIRRVTAEAQERRNLYGQRTILFVDEVHRWNKAQQDALLPWVENGTVIMIGATTENPFFEVNKALLSRSRLFQLVPLSEEELQRVAHMALADPERGYGALQVDLHPEALEHLVDMANGDARAVLNALELAIETTPPDSDGCIVVSLPVAEESIQRRAVLYDKDGDAHYDTISAFIKSLRGSDPDAALYWLARMVHAGEDPRFIFRRMIILASEDVGLADPGALQVVTAAAQAFDYVGMPEGRFHLAQAALYLATAPKANSTLAFFDALEAVEKERQQNVPTHLRDASRDSEGFGHGAGYLYPHAYRDHWVAQQYLPQALQGRVFYAPSDQGYERTIRDRVDRRREAQLAAMVEAPAEVLTFDPVERAHDQWLARTVSSVGEHLSSLRDRVLDAAHLARHHRLLDLNAGTGLLTWEALRRCPEGGIWALAADQGTAEALRQQAARIPEAGRPTVLSGVPDEVPELLALRGEADVRFEAIVGRSVLTRHPDREAAARGCLGLLATDGVVSLAESVPRHVQRLYRLVNLSELGQELGDRVRAAEEAIYADTDNRMVNWDAEDLRAAFEAAGFRDVQVELDHDRAERYVSVAQLERWFGANADATRPTYAQHLLRELRADELAHVRNLYEQQLAGRTVPWISATAYLVARKP